MAVRPALSCAFGAAQGTAAFVSGVCWRGGEPLLADPRARRHSQAAAPGNLACREPCWRRCCASRTSAWTLTWPPGGRAVAPSQPLANRARLDVRAKLSRYEEVRLRVAATRRSRAPSRADAAASVGRERQRQRGLSGAASANAFRAFDRRNYRLASDDEPVQLVLALSEGRPVTTPRPPSGGRPDRHTEFRNHDDIDFEPPSRSDLMKARWRDPVWRAAMLARRNTPEALRKRAEIARKQWQDPVFRARMRDARLGRLAPNKGVPPSELTRLRMSLSRRGVKKTDETRRRMSESKLNRPTDDTWPKRIAESKRGKTREYFQMRREFRALHKDLKLWSDSYRAQYGALPKESTFEMRVAAPMLAIKIKRYLMLKRVGGLGDDATIGYEIISLD